MITTHIFGGLGNQLFQYCCGRALSLRHNVKLRLLWDGREQENITTRRFDLGHFDIRSEVIMSTRPLRRLGLRSVQSFLQHGPARVFRESALGYDTRFASLGPHVRLKGYWQSEKFSRRSKIRSAKTSKSSRRHRRRTKPFWNRSHRTLQSRCMFGAVITSQTQWQMPITGPVT